VRDAVPTPIGHVVRGVVAAAIGTVAFDAVQYVEYRSGGGTLSFWRWEWSEGVVTWDDAPAPAHVGKRLIEGLFQRQLPASRARLTSNVMHWAYGAGWGGLLGLTAGSVRVSPLRLGPFFGAGVWASGYVVLGAMGLYKPIWTYPPRVLARDLGNHLVYGTTTGAALTALE
jgi:hypothetical protein